MENQPGVFSVWMKADQEDFPVTINYAKRKDVKVGKEWKRYEVVNPKLPKPGIYSSVSIYFEKKGTLWLDDMQAEYLESLDSQTLDSGQSLASPYRPSNLDERAFQARPVVERPPEITVPKLPDGLVPSGDLDSWKGRAARLDDFHCGDQSPANKTEAFLACDDDNLYVGYRCHVKNLSVPEVEACPRDSYKILGSDGVELFLSPEGGRESFQFAVDAAGSRFDACGDDPGWDGDWKCAAIKNPAASSVDYEITIPLKTLASQNPGDRWLVNPCRNDGEASEALALAKTPMPMRKDTRTWLRAQLPAEVANRHAVGAAAGGFSECGGGGVVSLDMRNNSGSKLAVRLELLAADSERKQLAAKDVELPPGASRLSLAVAGQPGEVQIKLSRDGEVVVDQIVGLEKRPLVAMLGRLSYYMNEPEAVFRAVTTLPDPGELTAVLSCGEVSVKRPAAAKFEIKLPLQKIPDSVHEVTLRLLRDGKSVAETTGELVKRPDKQGATQINRFSRSLLHDGKPIFPISPFMGDLWFTNVHTEKSCEDMTEFYVKHGFKFGTFLLSPKCARPLCLKTAKAILDTAKDRGFNIRLWLRYGDMTDDEIRKFNRDYDYPNIITQMVEDEPEPARITSGQLRDHVRRMKKFYPYRPVLVNHTIIGIGFGGMEESDILQLDDYLTNMDHRAVHSVVTSANHMWKVGAAEGKPCFYFLACANMPYHYKEPSYAEQIAQSYGCVAAGCTGLDYFPSPPQTPGNWKALLQVNQEIQALAEVLCSEEETSDATSSGDPKYLLARTKKHRGHLYVVACNIDDAPAGEVTFTLPTDNQYAKEGAPCFVARLLGLDDPEAEVLFENRKVPVRDGKFTDDFPGHSRHVYKVKINQGGSRPQPNREENSTENNFVPKIVF